MTWAPSTYFSFVMFFVILTVAVLSEKIHQLNPSLWAVFTIVGLGLLSLIFCVWRVDAVGKNNKKENQRRWYYFAAVISGLVVILTLVAAGV